MAEAARLVEEVYEPDFLDINFGCPVKKVVNRNGGSGCLRDLDLVQSIIRAVKGAISIPTTVKIRSGFTEDTRDPVSIALRCQDAGAEALTLHARTRTQMYSGLANWDEIAAVKAALDIPVIGNGDVWTGEDARRMHEHTRCDGIMIARGSHGQPWLFAQARAALEGRPDSAGPGPGGALSHRHRARAAGHRLGGRRGKGDDRVPQAPGLVHQGAAQRALLRQELFAVTGLDGGGAAAGGVPGAVRGSARLTPERLRALLAEVASGAVAVEEAERRLAWAPVEDLDFARVDHHRALRQGFPEVVFGAGQDAGAARRHRASGSPRAATAFWPRAWRADGAGRAARARCRPSTSTPLGRTAWLPAEHPARAEGARHRC